VAAILDTSKRLSVGTRVVRIIRRFVHFGDWGIRAEAPDVTGVPQNGLEFVGVRERRSANALEFVVQVGVGCADKIADRRIGAPVGDEQPLDAGLARLAEQAVTEARVGRPL